MTRVILGGGIGGLSAAHYLVKRFPLEKISLHEASQRTGGWIKTNTLPNGIKFEQGPRTIRPRGTPGINTLELIKDIGLIDQIRPIKSTDPAARNRMVYAKGNLNLLPSSFQDIFKQRPPFEKPLFYYVLHDLTTRKKLAKDGDESIYSFCERRFGKDIAEYAISPLVCGICAGDAKEVSVNFLMANLFEKEQKYGSVCGGLLRDIFKQNKEVGAEDLKALVKDWSIYSFSDGLEMFPIKLQEAIKQQGVEVNLNSCCTGIIFDNGKDGAILDMDGVDIRARQVISSLPAKKLANLVQNQHPELAQGLKSIPYVKVAVVNLHYDKNLFLPDAFGFLVPPSENIPILGVIFDSCCFPDYKNTVITVMMGGRWYDKWFSEDQDHLKVALEHVEKILNVTEEPKNSMVHILHDCIPQYIIGHSRNIKNIERYIRDHKLPLNICGSSYYGVGVNDVILSAKKAVMDL